MYQYRRNFSEKRRHLRMKMDCPVRFREIDSAQVITGTCIDLSASGVLVQSEQFYPLGTKLRIEVLPRLALSRPLNALIEVNRVRPVPQGTAYHIAGVIEHIES